MALDKDDVGPNDPGYYWRVQDFAADCKALSTNDMMKKHATAFLLHHGALGALNTPVGPQATIMINAKEGDNVPPPLQSDFLVFPVKISGRSPFPHFISVGRTRNNDVVIADISLSKFHAFFRQTADGMVLQDAGSKNGTILNGEAVPTQQQGAPMLVNSGAILSFGAVEMTFLDCESFMNLVKMLA